MTTPQVTCRCDRSTRLAEIDEPSGTTVTFGYDANGQRVKKTTQTGGSNPTLSQVNDTYQNGRLAYQTNLGGTVLATFTYDPSGVPESVVVGADPVNGPRYYYVYNGHGDVVALTDAGGNVVASYSYDVWGNITASGETIPNANGWTNPYRYDGKDGARYDVETGLYWLTTRAYDPTLGRFLQRDPLGRFPLFFWNQPYVYAGNNPLINVDPSGQRYYDGLLGSHDETAQQQIAQTRRTQRLAPRHPSGGCGGCNANVYGGSTGQAPSTRPCAARGAHPTCAQIDNAKQIAAATAAQLLDAALNLPILQVFLVGNGAALLRGFLSWVPPWFIPPALVAAAKVIVAGVLVALVAVMAQQLVASVLFKVQSGQPDSFWEEAATVQTSADVIKTDIVLLGGLIAALGLAVIGLVSNPFTIAIGAGLIAAGLGGLILVFKIALNGLTSEQQALGY